MTECSVILFWQFCRWFHNFKMLTFNWCQHFQLLVEGHKLFTTNVSSLAHTVEGMKFPGLPIRGVNMTEKNEQNKDTLHVIRGGGWHWLQIRLCNASECSQNGLAVLRLSEEKNLFVLLLWKVTSFFPYHCSSRRNLKSCQELVFAPFTNLFKAQSSLVKTSIICRSRSWMTSWTLAV